MAICGNCKQPCSCLIKEDGLWTGHTELGRNFTQVDGSGTTEDPYTIHFMDQDEFRPRTSEIAFDSFSLVSGTFTSLFSHPLAVSRPLYESPSDFLIREPSMTNTVHRYADGNFYSMGASATFSETVDATSNIRQILLVAMVESPLGNPVESILGAKTTPGGSVDPLTLSCEAFVPGIFITVGGLGGIRQQFGVILYQDSGSTLLVTDIRIWMTQI